MAEWPSRPIGRQWVRSARPGDSDRTGPEDDRDAVLDEFRQGRHGGRGMDLGLGIVRHDARAHGGDAWAEQGRAGLARIRASWPRSTT